MKEAKFDYDGTFVTKPLMLDHAKVAPAWPKKEIATRLNILDFFRGELWDDINDPARCLLPLEEWPVQAPSSRVHATDAEWYKLCKTGLDLGICCICPEEEVFRNQAGQLVVNGAMGIKKITVVDGISVEHMRFISIMCPSNGKNRQTP